MSWVLHLLIVASPSAQVVERTWPMPTQAECLKARDGARVGKWPGAGIEIRVAQATTVETRIGDGDSLVLVCRPGAAPAPVKPAASAVKK